MTLYRKILLAWSPFLLINFVAIMPLPDDAWSRIGRMTVVDLSSLLGVVSLCISHREVRKESRFVFLNLAVFFYFAGLMTPLYLLTKRWIFLLDEWANFYNQQYQTHLYFLLLSTSVVYLVVDLILCKLSIPRKYLVSFAVVGSIWGYLFFPYYANPKHLYATADIQDFRLIRSAMEELKTAGVANPTSAEIASTLGQRPIEGTTLGVQSSMKDRVTRVREILPYFQDDDVYLLVFRPLWRSCIVMSLVSIISILVFTTYQYIFDPPKSAFVEKIMWCLFLYCSFEALHHYLFIQVKTWKLYGAVNVIGWYLSAATMIALLFLLILRLGFIQSVEGRFYESRLIGDASHITRWRDAFDNWVLRQFMNPKELEQRFLIQSKDGAAKYDQNERPQ